LSVGFLKHQWKQSGSATHIQYPIRSFFKFYFANHKQASITIRQLSRRIGKPFKLKPTIHCKLFAPFGK
jgi:hypothetical protein